MRTKSESDSSSAKLGRSLQPSAYLRGASKAAAYLGVSRKAFREWRDDPTVHRRELLAPRIIRGDSYYCIARLDQFMEPASNAPGATIDNHLVLRPLNQ
jgi:hypothetical protein